MNEEKQIGFIVACKKFFGQRSDQSLKDFKDEISKLSAEEKAALRELLRAEGLNVK